MVKNPPANAGDAGDSGSIPGSGISPGGGESLPGEAHGRRSLAGCRPWGHSQPPLSMHTLTFPPELPSTVNLLRLETTLAWVPFPVVLD